MEDALKIADSVPEPVYHCPGEATPITAAVHRARLAAGWQTCESCAMREDGISEPTVSYAVSPGTRSIRRTSWGVRGSWQNVITRDVAAQLMSIVTAELIRQQAADDADPTDKVDPEGAVLSPKAIVVVTGYDGRSASPDIYAGVVSAALRNGVNVIDAGRCTAASVLEVCRSQPDACAAVLVTGAGEGAAATGFDLFSVQGAPVPVRWQDWNVTVRRIDLPLDDTDIVLRQAGHDSLHRLQSSMQADELTPYPGEFEQPTPTQSVTTLILPDHSDAVGGFSRRSRSSGQCDVISSEDLYRRHLRRWFPNKSRTRVTCLYTDDAVAERLTELAAELGMELDLVSHSGNASRVAQLQARVAEIRAHWGIAVSEDDRYATIVNRHGRQLSTRAMADWINQSIRNVMPHVTAHVPTDDDRIVLMDAGRPARPDSHEVISDGLAVMGCICKLLNEGSVLPHGPRAAMRSDS